MYWTLHNPGLSADQFLTEKYMSIGKVQTSVAFYFLMDFNDLNTSFFVIHSTFSLYFQIKKNQRTQNQFLSLP